MSSPIDKAMSGVPSGACATEELMLVPKSLVDFLLGIGPYDGADFGEKHPTMPGKYWWRNHLGRCVSAVATEKPADPGGDLMILRMALGNTAACLGDALATYNRFVGEDVFKNAAPQVASAAMPAPTPGTPRPGQGTEPDGAAPVASSNPQAVPCYGGKFEDRPYGGEGDSIAVCSICNQPAGDHRDIVAVRPVPTSADVPLCDGCAQAWFTERNHLKGDHGCVVCAFLGNRRSTVASSHGPLSTFGRDLVEGAYRKATPAENLRILAARLSEHLSPAEKRELEEAARLLSATAGDKPL